MLQKAVKFLSAKIKSELGDFNPEVAIVLGSGLGELADEYCDLSIPYSDIPNFGISSVAGHKSKLVFATINNKKVVMMQGRFHYYEGYDIQQVVFPIKVMKKLGVKTLILTNAAGGVNPAFNPSELMVITDHINNMHVNPLRGKNDDEMGTRFPDMSEIYTPSLIDIAQHVADKIGIDLQEGVYMAMTGPSYETPAEVKMARIMGADAIGMSTVPEAIVAKWAGMEVLGLSCISNSAAGVRGIALSHEDVIDAAKIVKDKFKRLILGVIKNL